MNAPADTFPEQPQVPLYPSSHSSSQPKNYVGLACQEQCKRKQCEGGEVLIPVVVLVGTLFSLPSLPNECLIISNSAIHLFIHL